LVFKRFERQFFILLLVFTFVCVVIGVYTLLCEKSTAAKWLACGGLLATAAGVVQLEVSGLFEKIMEVYGDDEKYPYGPPSHTTRQIIDNPDRPVRMWFRKVFFFDVRTGFWLIIGGILVQVMAVLV
jgi:hypothetical protein